MTHKKPDRATVPNNGPQHHDRGDRDADMLGYLREMRRLIRETRRLVLAATALLTALAALLALLLN